MNIITRGNACLIDNTFTPIDQLKIESHNGIAYFLDVNDLNFRKEATFASLSVNGRSVDDINELINALFFNYSSAIEATIEYAHWAVHVDSLVNANDFTQLASLSVRNYLVKVPASLELHTVFLIQADSACTIAIYEGTTVSADGTSIRHTRYNRYSTKNTLTTYHTPTITGDGTLLDSIKIFAPVSNSANQQFGGGLLTGRFGIEYVLKPSTNYLVRVTSQAADNDVYFRHEYYEVPANANNNEL